MSSSLPNDSAPLPTYPDVERVAAEHGFEVDEYFPCRTQGVLIAYSRPKRDGETFLGLPVAGERVRSEVIERHFCPEVVAPDVRYATVNRGELSVQIAHAPSDAADLIVKLEADCDRYRQALEKLDRKVEPGWRQATIDLALRPLPAVTNQEER